MVGQQVTRSQLDSLVGTVAIELKRRYEDAVSINEFLLRIQASDLIAMGYTQPEVDIIKSAMADLAYGKVNSFDSSTFVKQLYGLGV